MDFIRERRAQMRRLLLTIVVGAAWLSGASGIAAAQVITAQNPQFLEYYTMNTDAGPTCTFGNDTSPAAQFGWNIQSDVVGDFLGDGFPQILAGRISLNGNGTASAADWQQVPLRLLRNPGNGTLVDAGSAFNSPILYFPRDMAGADFNGDGLMDAFTADTRIDLSPYPGEPNQLLLSGPNHQLVNASGNIPDFAAHTHNTAAGAINGDGIQHIFVDNLNNPPGYLLINDGHGNFTINTSRLPAELLSPTFYTGVGLVDVNGDGFPDLILGGGDSSNLNKIYLNDGHGSVANSTPIALPPGCFDTVPRRSNTATIGIISGDLRGVGSPDLVLVQVPSTRSMEVGVSKS